VNEVIKNALNLIVSTTGSSGNMKKDLKTSIFDTVSNKRKLFAKLKDTNENNARKIIQYGKAGDQHQRERKEVGAEHRTTQRRHLALRRGKYIQTDSKVAQLTGDVDILYSIVVVGRTTQKVYKLTVTSRDNQAADTINEMMKSQINSVEIKVGIESIKSQRDGRVQIETGSIQEAETLENSIKDNLVDKIETHLQRPRKPKLKIINIPEEISIDNIQDSLMAEKLEIGIGKLKLFPNSHMRQKETHAI